MGSYIAIQKLAMEEYLIQFEKENARSLLDRRFPAAVWDYRNDTLFTTWEISLAAIEKEMPFASEVLHVCAFLAKDNIWEHLLLFGMGFQNGGRI